MSQEGSEDPPAMSAEAQADQAARDWLANVYQGDDAKQLSVRSIVTGMIIGGVMSISNLYVGLKSGWALTVTITSCIIAFAVFKALEAMIPAFRRDPFTILENYTMSSATSAAGYMASTGLTSAIPALFLATGRWMTWWEIMLWLGAVSTLGVFMAIPLKRQLINIEQLPFPEGMATAETLRSMHTTGAGAIERAKSLFYAGGVGGIVAIWRDALPIIGDWLSTGFSSDRLGKLLSHCALPEHLPFAPIEALRKAEAKYMFGLEGSLMMIAAGGIMGMRVCCSLLGGYVIYFLILGPWLLEQEIAKPGVALRQWTLWPGTAMMVTSGLLSFALKWRTMLRAFRGISTIVGQRSDEDDPLTRIEAPGSWFVVGTLVAGTACVLLGHFLFHITWWMGTLAVLLTFALSLVAARATGETSITPTGALGKVTQLTYAFIAPSNMETNLMTASVSAGAASHSADLLTDLKAGYLLGGNPRKQVLSQLFGVLAGTLMCVPVYLVIVTPEKLTDNSIDAPAARVWQAVAELLARGVDELPQGALAAMLISGTIGILLTIADEFAPQRFRCWIPSATGLGLAGVIVGYNSIAMFLGAIFAWGLSKWRPAIHEKYTVAVASGLIAGETLIGVAIKLWQAAPELLRSLMLASRP